MAGHMDPGFRARLLGLLDACQHANSKQPATCGKARVAVFGVPVHKVLEAVVLSYELCLLCL